MNWYAIYNKETKCWTVARVNRIGRKRRDVLYTMAMTQGEMYEYIIKRSTCIPVGNCYGSMKSFRKKVLGIDSK